MSVTRIVHCNKESYDTYIGRGGKWGNPYTHIADKDTLAEFIVGSREEAIEKYREYLVNNKELMAKLDELDGKTLGCWCHPKSCHGDVIIEVIIQQKLRDYFKNR
jgi:hypothetical protein